MKVIKIVADAGHGKTWTLDAVLQKASDEGKRVHDIEPYAYASELGCSWQAEVAELLEDTGGLERSTPVVLLLDEVPARLADSIEQYLDKHFSDLDYLFMAVEA